MLGVEKQDVEVWPERCTLPVWWNAECGQDHPSGHTDTS